MNVSNVGWFAGGIVAGVCGISVYNTYPSYGFYLIIIGIVAIVISLVVNKVIADWRKIKGSAKKGTRRARGRR